MTTTRKWLRKWTGLWSGCSTKRSEASQIGQRIIIRAEGKKLIGFLRGGGRDVPGGKKLRYEAANWLRLLKEGRSAGRLQRFTADLVCQFFGRFASSCVHKLDGVSFANRLCASSRSFTYCEEAFTQALGT